MLQIARALFFAGHNYIPGAALTDIRMLPFWVQPAWKFSFLRQSLGTISLVRAVNALQRFLGHLPSPQGIWEIICFASAYDAPAMGRKHSEPGKDDGVVDQASLVQRVLYNAQSLVMAISQQHDTGEVLMMAWMNAHFLTETLTTRRVCYWSRSRQTLWRKGEPP